jgi:6-phosphogluconolactonase
VYERELRDLLRTPVGPPRDAPGARIDLALLGVGQDGHTASLFPFAEAIHRSERWVEAVQAGSMWRVTMTPVLLSVTAEIAFIVLGHAKRTVLRQVLKGPTRPHELPAQMISLANRHVRWFADAAAAAEL